MKLNRNKLLKTVTLTDGGLETDMIYNHQLNLPHFASFPMIDKPDELKILKNYYRDFLEIAKNYNAGFILESPTWRANQDWGFKLGYNPDELKRINIQAIDLLRNLKNEYLSNKEDIYLSGQIGPRGDGYQVTNLMSVVEADVYHGSQIAAFKSAGADMVSAHTMTYINEALGIVKAAMRYDIPVVISFTVELDGNLPSGEKLEDAINFIDKITDTYPLHYMINCAHPSHFIEQLIQDGEWKERIGAIRANASCKSHTELDNATELDAGDHEDLGNWHQKLMTLLPNLVVFGGCCGTDVSHIETICNRIHVEHSK